MEQSVEMVAENLKTLRESRGLSLDQLSELTGVSKSMLRQIETGKSSPTIATMWKVANGLRVTFTSLLKKPEPEVEVRSFKSSEPLTAVSRRYRLYPLISFDPQQPVETYYFEVDPDTTYEGNPHDGDVYEYLFVIRGSMEINVGGKISRVSEGEFMKFLANSEHSYTCLGTETAAAIMQVSYHG